MNITLTQSKRRSEGYALLLITFFLAITLMVIASTMMWTSNSSTMTSRNNQYSQSVSAAEAATEAVISQMTSDYRYQGALTNLSRYSSILTNAFAVNGSLKNFQFTDGNGGIGTTFVTNLSAAVVTNLNSEFLGLYGLVTPYRVISNVQQTNGYAYPIVAAVGQDFQLASIPVFQYAIFYQIECEINPGVMMTINGPVHCNATIYTAPNPSLTYSNTVTATGNIINDRDPNDPQYGLTQVAPDFIVPPVTGANALTLPIGTNSASPTAVLQILQVPPIGESALSTLGQQRYYNKCDLIVTVATNGVVSLKTGYWNSFVSILADTTNGYSFIKTTNSFYDYREGQSTIVTDISIKAFTNWMFSTNLFAQNVKALANGQLNRNLNSIYVNDQRSVAGKLTVVRIKNAQLLPSSGLTIATASPLYVLGHFNAPDTTPGSVDTSQSFPASLAADAITVLSTNWSDTNYTILTSLGSRATANLTINAAFLGGIVPTTVSNGIKEYSGGVENFPRFLESWNGSTFTYNGSMVVLFTSQYATNFWQSTGIYYKAPTRAWGFDANFLNWNKLPPCTPQMAKVQRGQWTVWAPNRNN